MPALNVTPEGSAPVIDNAGAGKPVAATVNVPALATVKVAAFALVIAGACCTPIVTVPSEVAFAFARR